MRTNKSIEDRLRQPTGWDLLAAPCVFCAYNGERYWSEWTHASTCPWHRVGSDMVRRYRLRDVMREAADALAAAREEIAELKRGEAAARAIFIATKDDLAAERARREQAEQLIAETRAQLDALEARMERADMCGKLVP